MNNISLVGRLTKDVDLRYTQNGKAVASFNLAVNRPFKNANGEQEADFINCNIWGRPAENLANFMSKGSQIGITGRIQTRSYENQEGKRIFVTEVVADNAEFLEPRNGQKSTPQNNNNQSNTNTPNQQQNNSQGTGNGNKNTIEGNGEPTEIIEDDLPF